MPGQRSEGLLAIDVHSVDVPLWIATLVFHLAESEIKRTHDDSRTHTYAKFLRPHHDVSRLGFISALKGRSQLEGWILPRRAKPRWIFYWGFAFADKPVGRTADRPQRLFLRREHVVYGLGGYRGSRHDRDGGHLSTEVSGGSLHHAASVFE